MRALLITPALPWPLESFGAAQRTWLLAEALRRVGDVEILHVGPRAAGAAHSPAALAGAGVVASFECPEPQLAGWGRGLAAWPGPVGRLGRLVAEYAGLFRTSDSARAWLSSKLAAGRYELIVARYVRSLARAGCPRRSGAAVLVDVDDLDSTKFMTQVARAPWPGLGGAIGMSLVSRTLAGCERRTLQAADGAWVAHAADERLIPRSTSAGWLPNVPFRADGGLPAPAPEAPNGRVLLFVGLLDYLPNVDGMNWFLERVWPSILEAEPAARLRIAGARLAAGTARRWSALEGVEYLGFVSDLDALYATASLCIAPVRWGGGTNIKVLEALAHGRVCIAAEHAARGFATLRESGGLVAAERAADFAAATIALLRDAPGRVKRAAAGRAVVQEQFSPESFIRRVLSTVGQTMERVKRQARIPLIATRGRRPADGVLEVGR